MLGYDPVVSSDLVREKDVATLFFRKVSTWFKGGMMQLFSLESLVQSLKECCNSFLKKGQYIVQERDVATLFFRKFSTEFKRRMLQLFSFESLVQGSREGCCNSFL